MSSRRPRRRARGPSGPSSCAILHCPELASRGPPDRVSRQPESRFPLRLQLRPRLHQRPGRRPRHPRRPASARRKRRPRRRNGQLRLPNPSRRPRSLRQQICLPRPRSPCRHRCRCPSPRRPGRAPPWSSPHCPGGHGCSPPPWPRRASFSGRADGRGLEPSPILPMPLPVGRRSARNRRPASPRRLCRHLPSRHSRPGW